MIKRRKMKEIAIDALDRAILGALLEDGRLSQVELAERIPLSATAIARRIRALEERGIIQGYQARISRQALGLTMTVIVQIGLKSQNEDLLKAFEEAVASAPSVVSCHLMSGEDDYLVTVMARDLADFERIHKEQLSRLPGVARLKSSFALRDVTSRALPASCLLPSRKWRSRILDSGIVPDAGIARFNGTTKCDTLSSRHLPSAGASNAWFITTFGGVLAMSRTPLFAAVKKALARSFHEQGLVVPQSSALTRRRLLRLSAAAAGAAALSPVLDWSAYAKQERPKGPVAIVGGGVAGLTAAYRLQPPARRRLCSRRAIVGADACSPNTISTRACSASSAASSSTPVMRICRSSPRKSAWRCRT